MKPKRFCTQCGSPKYYCKGLCKSCYNKQLVSSRWSQNSDFCVQCRSSEFPHVAHGLCRRCYATQPSNVLCACGCGQAVTQWGNKTRKYIHGHKIRDMWKDKAYRTWHISLFRGENNPMYGKFGENHPAHKHKKSEKFRIDSSKRMLDRMSNGERKTTNIEIILSKILDEINIEHHPQHLMYNKFVVDEYLPDSGLVIEAYGGYWHGDPKKYPVLSNLQIKNQKRDNSRIKYLNKCGHLVLVLWEDDLLHHIDLCKASILDAIKFIQTN